MSETVVVVYDGQVLRPETPLDLEANMRYLVTITPVDPAAAEDDAWDVLDKLAGTVDGPLDWASEHDHYLYGTAKRSGEASE